VEALLQAAFTKPAMALILFLSTNLSMLAPFLSYFMRVSSNEESEDDANLSTSDT
jgi:hypothetical protein